MMRRRSVWSVRLLCAVFVAVLAVTAARPAAADVSIAGVSLDMNPDTGPLRLAGDHGFAFEGRVSSNGGVFMPGLVCRQYGGPCSPGDTISLRAYWSGLDAPGAATFEGVSYFPVGSGNSSLVAEFNGSVVLPPLADTATVVAPVRFDGAFYYPSGVEALVGTGSVTLSLVRDTVIPNRWRLLRALYELGAPVPSPWVSQDVGATGRPGRASYVGSADALIAAGAGSDIWGTSDSFHFVYQALPGAGEVVARVGWQENTHAFAKAGVMLRASPAADAAAVILDRRPDGSLEFMVRYAPGEAMQYIGGGSAPGSDVWLKLARSGDGTITAQASSGGAPWTIIGSVRLAVAPTGMLAGVAVTSHNPSVLSAALFDSVDVTSTAAGGDLLVRGDFEAYAPPLLGPPGWVSDDLLRQSPAKSETHQPRSGAKNGACWTPGFLDCGMYQDVVAPASGAYTLQIYAASDRSGGLVGANVNGSAAASAEVLPGPFGGYRLYSMTFSANAGDTIRVWMYSPAVPGYVVIDNASLTTDGAP